MHVKKIIFSLLLVIFGFLSGIGNSYAYWNSLSHTTEQITITIGEWNFIPIWDEEEEYEVGEEFIYNDSIWIVVQPWFDNSEFLNPDGSVNLDYVKPYGPVEENTNEWRSYNTYHAGETVIYDSFTWIVRHEGANSARPGSATNAWNRLDENWFMFNTYNRDEITIYNGHYWKALTNSWNQIPGQVNWAWKLIE